MIKEIEIKSVASYSKDGSGKINIDESNPINLFYGLNGSGKTTITREIEKYNKGEDTYSNILIKNQNIKLITYNKDFIENNFLDKDNLKGIFSLGEENKKIENQINLKEKKVGEFETDLKEKEKSYKNFIREKNIEKRAIFDLIYREIKSHKNRNLDFCLRGFITNKNKTIEKLNETKIDDENLKLEVLETDAKILEKDASKIELMKKIDFSLEKIEKEDIFSKRIVSANNSNLSDVINKLNNSDWVKTGQKYLDKSENNICPFCQQKLPEGFSNEISKLFDKSYEDSINKIKKILINYNNYIDSDSINYIRERLIKIKEESLIDKNFYDFIFEKLNNLEMIFGNNIKKIENKIEKPSKLFSLEKSSKIINDINELLNKINSIIIKYNKKIEDLDLLKNQIIDNFWKYYKNKFISQLKQIDKIEKEIEDVTEKYNEKKEKIIDEKALLTNKIFDLRKKIVNIDKSIENINKNLIFLGIKSFKITKKEIKDVNYYRIIRGMEEKDVYKTLSEGEKTLISFLYFLEICKGSLEENNGFNNKIILIDDPISSLSNIFMYEIAHLIYKLHQKSKSKILQIFVFSHSLYFINELRKLFDKKVRKCNYFMVKKDDYSYISEFDNEKIRNDYEMYWNYIKDYKNGELKNTIMIPNVMRNIIENFFSFIGEDFNNVIRDISDNNDDISFLAFKRFINRESHSDGINLDTSNQKIIEDKWLEYFKNFFIEAGYEKHYNIMINK